MERGPGLTRRDFCGSAAATVASGALGGSTLTALDQLIQDGNRNRLY